MAIITGEKMKNTDSLKLIASAISKLTQPSILIMLLLVVVLFSEHLLPQLKSFLICSILLVIVPILSIYLWSKHLGEGHGEISSNFNRLVPYSISALSFILCVIILIFLGNNLTYLFISSSLMVSTILLFLINLFTKVSVHVGGVSLVCGLSLCLYQLWGLPLFILLALVFWGRSYLNKHTYLQMIFGALIGLVVPFCMYYLLTSIIL